MVHGSLVLRPVSRQILYQFVTNQDTPVRIRVGHGENALMENAGVDSRKNKILSGISELTRRIIAVAYCKCKAASGNTLLVCISRLIAMSCFVQQPVFENYTQ